MKCLGQKAEYTQRGLATSVLFEEKCLFYLTFCIILCCYKIVIGFIYWQKITQRCKREYLTLKEVPESVLQKYSQTFYKKSKRLNNLSVNNLGQLLSSSFFFISLICLLLLVLNQPKFKRIVLQWGIIRHEIVEMLMNGDYFENQKAYFVFLNSCF